MWDERYRGSGFAYGTEPNDFIRENAGRLPVGDTLSLGEGEGRNAVFLARLGHRVTALDGARVGLEKARGFATQNGVEIETLHIDLGAYEFETERWDVIVSVFCHLPPALRKKVHGQIFRALRPGGCFILEAYTPQQLDYNTGGPKHVTMMMELATLRAELGDLAFEWGHEGVREITEGTYHSGPGATVQLIARKLRP